jgi:hypothetical protein
MTVLSEVAGAGLLDPDRAATETAVLRAIDLLDDVAQQAVELERRLTGFWGPEGGIEGGIDGAFAVAAVCQAQQAAQSLDVAAVTVQARKFRAGHRCFRPTGETPFIGWWRPAGRRQKWREVCQGATEEECLDRLLGAAQGGDKMVLETGRRPEETRGPR